MLVSATGRINKPAMNHDECLENQINSVVLERGEVKSAVVQLKIQLTSLRI